MTQPHFNAIVQEWVRLLRESGVQRKTWPAITVCVSLVAGGIGAVWAEQGGGDGVIIPLRGSVPLAEPVPDGPTIEDAVPGPDGIRRAVVMQGLDKITGRTTEFIAPLGVPVSFYKLTVTARACNQRPPEETPETSVYLDVLENSLDGRVEQLFSGWMFASSPALSALEHPVYDVWVVSCKTNEPGKEEAPTTRLLEDGKAPGAAEADEPPVIEEAPGGLREVMPGAPDEPATPSTADPATPAAPPSGTPAIPVPQEKPPSE